MYFAWQDAREGRRGWATATDGWASKSDRQVSRAGYANQPRTGVRCFVAGPPATDEEGRRETTRTGHHADECIDGWSGHRGAIRRTSCPVAGHARVACDTATRIGAWCGSSQVRATPLVQMTQGLVDNLIQVPSEEAEGLCGVRAGFRGAPRVPSWLASSKRFSTSARTHLHASVNRH